MTPLLPLPLNGGRNGTHAHTHGYTHSNQSPSLKVLSFFFFFYPLLLVSRQTANSEIRDGVMAALTLSWRTEPPLCSCIKMRAVGKRATPREVRRGLNLPSRSQHVFWHLNNLKSLQQNYNVTVLERRTRNL